MTSMPWISTLLAAVVGVGAVPGAAAQAHAGPRALALVEDPVPVEGRRVRLEIDVTGLAGYEGFEPGVYEEMARLALRDALRDRGHEVVDSGGAGTPADVVVVALSWRDFDASVFEVVFSAQSHQAQSRTLPSHLCERCSDDELVSMLETHLGEALAALEAQDSATTTEPGPSGPASGGTAPDESPHRRGRLAPMAATGIAVGLLGLGGVVAGAVLVSKDDRIEPAPEGDRELIVTDYRPPGIGLLVGGGVVLAAGVGLVIAGQLRHAKRKPGEARSDRAAERGLAWAPVAARRGLGLGISGRF